VCSQGHDCRERPLGAGVREALVGPNRLHKMPGGVRTQKVQTRPRATAEVQEQKACLNVRPWGKLCHGAVVVEGQKQVYSAVGRKVCWEGACCKGWPCSTRLECMKPAMWWGVWEGVWCLSLGTGACRSARFNAFDIRAPHASSGVRCSPRREASARGRGVRTCRCVGTERRCR